MSSRPPEIILLGVLVGVAVTTHILLKNSLFSFIPAPIFLSLVFTWIFPARWYWLAVLLLFTELLSSFAPGVLSLAVLLPHIIWRLRGRIEIDLSFSFLLIILTTVTLQFSVLASAAIMTIEPLNLARSLEFLPWLELLIGITLTTLAAFITLLALNNWSVHSTPVVSLSHIRYGRTFNH